MRVEENLADLILKTAARLERFTGSSSVEEGVLVFSEYLLLAEQSLLEYF